MLGNDPDSDNVAAISWELEQRYPKEYGEDKGECIFWASLMIESLFRAKDLLKQYLLSDPDDDCDS